MNALRKFFYTFLFCGIFLTANVFSRENNEWKQADSESFHIISNASTQETAFITHKLESFRRSFFKLFQVAEGKSAVPTRLLIFKSKVDYENYLKTDRSVLPENSFYAGTDANYFLIAANGAETDLRTAYHQYFHYLLSNYVGKSKIPAWLNEGLAQVFENFQTNADLKNSFYYSGQQNESLLQSKFLPSEVFFKTDYYSLNQQPNHRDGIFFAQSAVWVKYLIEKGNDENFGQFINSLLSGTSLNEALIKSFQTDVSSIENNLRNFIGQKTVKKIQSNQEIISSIPDLKFSPLSEAATEALLGDFLYQSNHLDEAELHLLKSLSLNSLAAFPKSTLGLIKLRRYDFDEAFQQLEKAIEYKDANYLNYYRAAFALSRRGMTEYGFVSNYDAETAEKMRELLSKALALNPDFAESYNLYAFAGFVRNEEIDESLNYIAKALRIAPGNDWYLLRKAELEMRKENFTEARKIAQKIYQTAPNEGMRLYAENTMQRIDSTEYQLLNARRTEKLPYSAAISEVPFSDEEIARLRAKAMGESLNAVLRRPLPDQKRILGSIVGIDCRKNQVDFLVKSDNQTLKLRADSFESLNLMTFNAGLSKAAIGCGAINADYRAVIIYRKPFDSKPDISGEVVSIEFVPKEFALSENE